MNRSELMDNYGRWVQHINSVRSSTNSKMMHEKKSSKSAVYVVHWILVTIEVSVWVQSHSLQINVNPHTVGKTRNSLSLSHINYLRCSRNSAQHESAESAASESVDKQTKIQIICNAWEWERTEHVGLFTHTPTENDEHSLSTHPGCVNAESSRSRAW